MTSHRFKQRDIKETITKVLESRLVGKKYDSEEMAEISKEICTEIKEKVKGERAATGPEVTRIMRFAQIRPRAGLGCGGLRFRMLHGLFRWSWRNPFALCAVQSWAILGTSS